MGKPGFKFGDKFEYQSPWEETESALQDAMPKISLKCSPSKKKIKIGCIVDIYFKLDGSSGWSWGYDYNIKLSSTDKGLKIYDDSFDLDKGWTFIAQISNAQKGTSPLIMSANNTQAATFNFEFVDEKSAFTRSDKDVVVTENENLQGNDKVCFRVADKTLAKLLNDTSLILSSYKDLSGFTRMDEYKKKGYVFESKKFDQSTIWKRHTEAGYQLMPYEFKAGQESCFSTFVKETMPCMGIHVYHYILLNGYHVLILLVDNTNSCNTKYKILDQLKIREWDDLGNLDTALLTMTRNNYIGACNFSNRKDINSSINLCKIKSR